LGCDRGTAVPLLVDHETGDLVPRFIGYQVRSVPLERIADVVISRTLPEMVAGISSIEIRDMTGQIQLRNNIGSGGSKWIGVRDAPEIQKRILEQIKQVNENAKKI
jgi:hypothetical protein